MIEQPVDTFSYELLSGREEHKDLWTVFQMVLVISHSQADTERGFSVNKDISNDNMQEELSVAYRRVHHGVISSSLVAMNSMKVQ